MISLLECDAIHNAGGSQGGHSHCLSLLSRSWLFTKPWTSPEKTKVLTQSRQRQKTHISLCVESRENLIVAIYVNATWEIKAKTYTRCVWPRVDKGAQPMTKSAPAEDPFVLCSCYWRTLWEIVRFNCTRACRFSYLNWPQNTFLIACAQAHTVGALHLIIAYLGEMMRANGAFLQAFKSPWRQPPFRNQPRNNFFLKNTHYVGFYFLIFNLFCLQHYQNV